MAYQQVAKLYLRGSLCNKVLRELSPEKRQEVEDLVNLVMDDPILRRCRRSFCNALAGTIHNEYEDREVGEQDYRIALMRAAVAAICGWAGNEPIKDTLSDPVQRKKWFQTWAFNYMRQILRENKIPVQKFVSKITVPADEAAVVELRDGLSKLAESEKNIDARRILRSLLLRLEIKEKDDWLLLKFDHFSFPSSIIELISKLNSMYLSRNVEITYGVDGILVKRTTPKVPMVQLNRVRENFVKVASFDVTDEEDENNSRDSLEHNVVRREDNRMETEEMLTKLHERIPDEAHDVLAIYNEDSRPSNYFDRYGPGSPKISHIAEYLNKSPREIKKIISVIRLQCMAIKLGY